ncbi:hypothetical protein [Nocardia sp. Marseille-Q1738]
MSRQGTHGDPDLVRFGQMVKARRDALGLTQEEVSALGGPSDTTFTKIENLEWRPGRTATLRKLDAGLQWEPGSSARILYEGGDPIPLNQSGVGQPAAVPDADLAIELTVLAEFAVQSVWSVFQAAGKELPGAQSAIEQLDAVAEQAEKLALQVTGGGEEFAMLRRQVRARMRIATESLTEAALRSPAALAAEMGQAAHPDDDWSFGNATDGARAVALSDADRHPDA